MEKTNSPKSFAAYPEIPELTSETDNNPREEPVWLRKFLKQLRKNSKRIKKLREAEKRRVEAENQRAVETTETQSKQKSFLSKLGDAVIKAIPAIITAAVSAFFGFMFKRKSAMQDESQAITKAFMQMMKQAAS